ncbi:MAG: ABC transporter permease [Bacillota bacterium]
MRETLNFALRSLAARSGRTAVTAAAVALAVALASALTLIGLSYQGHLLREAEEKGGLFDLSVRVANPTEGEQVRDLARSTPGVREAVGSLSFGVGQRGPHSLVSLAFEPSSSLGRLIRPVAGRLPVGEGEIALEEWAAAEFGLAPGDRLTLGGQEVEVVGLVAELPGSRPLRRAWVLFSVPGLQALAGRPGELDTINLLVDPGVSVQSVADALARRVGQRGRIDVNQPLMAARASIASMGRILAAVILFTAGAGLIVTLNTFQISVMERIGQVGILKALGMGRRQLAALWLAEGLLLGGAGGLAGLAAGLGLAPLLARLAAVVLLAPPWWLYPAGLGLALAIALLAAWLPARRAGRVPVLEAMQPWRSAGLKGLQGDRRALWAGSLLLASGLAPSALFGLLQDEHPLGLPAGLAGVFLTVAGATLLTPAALASLLHRRDPEAGLGSLARANLLRHRSRTAVTISTLLLGVTLLTSFSGVLNGQRLRQEADLARRVPTDYVVEHHPSRGGLAAATGRQVASWPEVESFTAVKFAHVLVGGGQAGPGPRGSQSILLGIEPDAYFTLARVSLSDAERAALEDGAVLATKRAAEHFGLKPGDTVTVRRNQQSYTLTVAGVVDHEPELAMGAFLIEKERVVAMDANDLEHRYLINLAPGADGAQLARRLRSAAPGADIISLVGERERLAREAAEILAYVAAMVGLVALIAISGMFNTLVASVRERTREIGLLRSLGVTRGGIFALIAGEACLMALSAVVTGTVLGGLTAFVLGWGLSGAIPLAFLPPPALLLVIPAAALGLGLLASAWPAWWAGQIPPGTQLRAE